MKYNCRKKQKIKSKQVYRSRKPGDLCLFTSSFLLLPVLALHVLFISLLSFKSNRYVSDEVVLQGHILSFSSKNYVIVRFNYEVINIVLIIIDCV